MSSNHRSIPKRPQGTPIQNWLQAKDFRDNRHWIISEGVAFTKVGEEWLNHSEFDRLYPVPSPVHFMLADENPDGTRAYLK